jgi:phosphoribosyl 1,2-cyclic phosphodiesterase
MTLLFHDHIIVAPLGSGSRGNATYIGNGRRGVLVDCGLSTLQIGKRMEAVGLGDSRIDAVLITHEHSDHVGAARILDKRLQRQQNDTVPFFMTAGTARGLNPKVVPREIELITAGTAFEAGPFRIEPYHVPHDTREPVAFAVCLGSSRVGVITDLGRPTRLVERMLASFDVAVLEFNHDVEMLRDGPYPWRLKQRVRGPHGHLSNEQAADVLRRGAGDRLRHVVLAHLSEENNQPHLAREAAATALHDIGRSDVQISIASQQSPLPPLEVPLQQPQLRPKRTRHAAAAPKGIEPARPPRQMALF